MLKINIQVSIVFELSKNECMKINHFFWIIRREDINFIVGSLYFIMANKNKILKRSSKKKMSKTLVLRRYKKTK